MEEKELKAQYDSLTSEIREAVRKMNEEITNSGQVHQETKAQLAAMQKQLDSVDAAMQLAAFQGKREVTKSLIETLKGIESLNGVVGQSKWRGGVAFDLDAKTVREHLEFKTTVTSSAVGFPTYGVMPYDQDTGIVLPARTQPAVRSVLPSRPTSFGEIMWVKVNAGMARASMQTEGSAKAEQAITFTTDSEAVRTVANWIPATKQVLADWSELGGFLQSELIFAVNAEEDYQLLFGDGNAPNLNGVYTQATAFDTTLLNATNGWTKQDIVARAIQQVAVANEVEPTFVLMNPKDWWDIVLTKDSNKQYMIGGPQSAVGRNLWGLTVVPTTRMTSGTFLVGAGIPSCIEIRDREGLSVEISTEHSDYFTKNMVAIRGEKRLALVVKRAAAFIYGTFTTSPSQ